MKTILGTFFVLALGAVLGSQIIAFADSRPSIENSRFSLKCDRYEKAELYLMCEQAKAAKDMAETMKRVEKKLPDFNEFN